MPVVLTLSGSPSPSSRTAAIAADVGTRLAARGFEVTALDIRDLPADDLFNARLDVPALRDAVGLVERADGIVIATPVYKAAYSGMLKCFLDVLPQFGLTGKTVLPLATGGSLAHVLMLDYALRPVLTSMNARHVVNGLFFLDKLVERRPEGGIAIEAEVEKRLGELIDDFAASLPR